MVSLFIFFLFSFRRIFKFRSGCKTVKILVFVKKVNFALLLLLCSGKQPASQSAKIIIVLKLILQKNWNVKWLGFFSKPNRTSGPMNRSWSWIDFFASKSLETVPFLSATDRTCGDTDLGFAHSKKSWFLHFHFQPPNMKSLMVINSFYFWH